MIERFFRNWAVPAFLFGIKIFTVIRTGIDTLIVAGALRPEVTFIQFLNAVLYVLLIDAVMTGLWLYAAYGGDSAKAQRLKLFAILGAWTLYGGMIIVGWSAHPEAPFLALLGRIAGACALGYDTYDYISGPIRLGLLKLAAWLKNRAAGQTPEDAYKQMMNRELVGALRQANPMVRKTITGQLTHRLEVELPEMVNAMLPVPSVLSGITGITDVVEAEAHETLPKGYGAAAIQHAWETCCENFDDGTEFRRSDIEECTQLGRSQAGMVLNYGMNIGAVERVGHGRYIFHAAKQLPDEVEMPDREVPDVIDQSPVNPVDVKPKPDF